MFDGVEGWAASFFFKFFIFLKKWANAAGSDNAINRGMHTEPGAGAILILLDRLWENLTNKVFS